MKDILSAHLATRHHPEKSPVSKSHVPSHHVFMKEKTCKLFNTSGLDTLLVGGFKYFLCSSLLGEDSHFD